MYSIIPYEYENIYPVLPALLSLALDAFCFLMGVFFIKSMWDKELMYASLDVNVFTSIMRTNEENTKKIFYVSIMLGLIGVVLKIYMRLYQQDITSFANTTEFRLHLNDDQVDGGALGLISAILYPFGFVSLTLLIYFKEYLDVKKGIYFLVWFIGLFFGIDGYLAGGRTSFVVLASLIFFTYALKFYHAKIEIKILSIKNIIYLLCAFFGFLYFSSIIIFQRLELFGTTTQEYIAYMTEGREISLSSEFINFMQDDDALGFNKFVFTLVEFLHYYVHGVFEYIRLYNHFDFDHVWYGIHEYFIYFKFFDRLGLFKITYLETLQGYYKTGVYTTLFGPSLIDFGHFTFLYALFLGSVFQLLYYKALSGKIIGLLLYPFVATTIIFSPMINIMTGSVLYIFNALLMSYFIARITNSGLPVVRKI